MATWAWHAEEMFLCDLGPTRIPVITELVAQLPEGPWRELHEFLSLDSKGNPIRRYDVAVISDEDDLTLDAFGVVGNEFRMLILKTHHGRVPRTLLSTITVHGGLREETDAGTLELLKQAVATLRKRQEEEAARRLQAGDARVAEIPGSTVDPGLGKDYLRAQALLRERVRSYGIPRDMQLLEVLGRFGALARSFGRPLPVSLDLAIRHFVEGCRHAAFDSGVKPTADADLPADPDLSSKTADLRALLDVFRGALRNDAEVQENADALNNATAFRKAAACLDRTLKRLEP